MTESAGFELRMQRCYQMEINFYGFIKCRYEQRGENAKQKQLENEDIIESV